MPTRELGAGLPAVQTLTERERLPLSWNQRKISMLSVIGSNTAYVGLAFEAHAPPDVAAVERALQALARRHEVLRSCYVQAKPEDYAVLADMPTPVHEADLVGLDADAQRASCIALGLRHLPDPWSGPVLQGFVLRLAPSLWHVEILTLHLFYDKQSARIFAREFRAFYDAEAHGVPAALPALRFQYADWAAWQRDYARSVEGKARIAYWHELVKGAEFASLPNHATGLPETSPPGIMQRELEMADWGAALRRLRATGSLVSMAALFIAVARESGRREVIIPCSGAGREVPGSEGLIGFFTAEKIWRIKLEDTDTFADVVATLRAQHQRHSANMGVPIFETLETSFETIGRFNFGYAIDHTRAHDDDSAELRLLPSNPLTRPPANQRSFEFGIWLREGASTLSLLSYYAADLHPPEQVAAFVDSFAAILRAGISAPSTTVGELLAG